MILLTKAKRLKAEKYEITAVRNKEQQHSMLCCLASSSLHFEGYGTFNIRVKNQKLFKQ
jgi:hypothetical protein